MAKRTTKAQNFAFGILIIIALIVAAIAKVVDAVGYVAPLLICGAGIGAFVWHKISQKKKRLEYLRNKYRDEAIVQRILSHRFWQGQTSEQLIDSLGEPTSVDTKVLKAKTRNVWKYNPRGTNRYALRITLEGNIVIGWDQKSW
jgi:hypothetical protein